VSNYEEINNTTFALNTFMSETTNNELSLLGSQFNEKMSFYDNTKSLITKQIEGVEKIISNFTGIYNQTQQAKLSFDAERLKHGMRTELNEKGVLTPEFVKNYLTQIDNAIVKYEGSVDPDDIVSTLRPISEKLKNINSENKFNLLKNNILTIYSPYRPVVEEHDLKKALQSSRDKDTVDASRAIFGAETTRENMIQSQLSWISSHLLAQGIKDKGQQIDILNKINSYEGKDGKKLLLPEVFNNYKNNLNIAWSTRDSLKDKDFIYFQEDKLDASFMARMTPIMGIINSEGGKISLDAVLGSPTESNFSVWSKETAFVTQAVASIRGKEGIEELVENNINHASFIYNIFAGVGEGLNKDGKFVGSNDYMSVLNSKGAVVESERFFNKIISTPTDARNKMFSLVSSALETALYSSSGGMGSVIFTGSGVDLKTVAMGRNFLDLSQGLIDTFSQDVSIRRSAKFMTFLQNNSQLVKSLLIEGIDKGSIDPEINLSTGEQNGATLSALTYLANKYNETGGFSKRGIEKFKNISQTINGSEDFKISKIKSFKDLNNLVSATYGDDYIIEMDSYDKNKFVLRSNVGTSTSYELSNDGVKTFLSNTRSLLSLKVRKKR